MIEPLETSVEGIPSDTGVGTKALSQETIKLKDGIAMIDAHALAVRQMIASNYNPAAVTLMLHRHVAKGGRP